MSSTDLLKKGAVFSLKVKKIVLGAIEAYSGNEFFRGILDNHPEVLMLEYGYLNENLFYICIRLAMEKGENILKLFWELYATEGSYYNYGKRKIEEDKLQAFNQNMEEMLSQKETYTSQELFVLIHVAYARIWNKNIENVSNMIIYWEPHYISREILEDYAIWLSIPDISGNIVNVVRNAYISRGSCIKDLATEGLLPDNCFKALRQTVFYSNKKKKDYDGWKRIVVRFEDLKCYPQKELLRICKELDIGWSDTLLETTFHGNISYMGDVTGFALEPVYRTYEEYYSEFDRFRISLAAGFWQKQHGYPYVSSLGFSKKELRGMFMKEFCFEERMTELSEDEKENMKENIQNIINYSLWKVRRDEIMESICQ